MVRKKNCFGEYEKKLLCFRIRGATSAVKEKEKFEKEKARLQGELDGTKLKLTNALNFIEELEQRNTAAEETISKLEEQLEVTNVFTSQP